MRREGAVLEFLEVAGSKKERTFSGAKTLQRSCASRLSTYMWERFFMGRNIFV